MNKTNTRKALNPAYRKHKPLRKDVTNFITQLKGCIDAVKLSDDRGESEEHIKSHFKDFFTSTFYSQNYINTKDRIDLAIYLDSTAKSDIGVIIEAKKPSNKAEFLTEQNLNRKALQELLLYYLRERVDNENNNIKHLIATNGYEWFLFKAEDFYNIFYKNKELIKEYKSFRDGLKDTTKNELFYYEIAKKYIAKIEQELPFVHLDFSKTKFDRLNDSHLNTLYKIFSNVHLLGHSFGNDGNQLNKSFYNELLHIIGLEEVKEKGKKVISRKSEEERDYASILENAIYHLENRDYLPRVKSVENSPEKAFNVGLELCLSWINRILFLKLLESQLLAYHKNEIKYKFLNSKFVRDYDELNDLFFSALAKQEDERHPKYKDKYKDIPYLNSSLFERNTLESEAFEISALSNDECRVYGNTILKDASGKREKGKLPTLDYLFRFLDAYDFATDGNEGIEDAQEAKSLINASVLGLIFEKINGYKEGSFYTPAYITMYMCRETLRRTVVQKFKEQENDQIETFQDLKSYCHRYFKVDDLKCFNDIVNSLRVCDPAVGSGHFLVSALNELIVIKNELGILVDAKGLPLRCDIEIVNDELYVIDDNGLLFEYIPTDKESIRTQHTLFHEKQTLIENCLFGVDINPNSVKICRLRLWIELLKNAYYTNENRLQTLPNIDINIKTGNSLINRFNLDDDLKDAFKGKEVSYNFKDYKNAVAEYKDTNSKERKREVLEIINEVKHNFKSSLDNTFISKFQKAQGDYINEEERLKNLKAFGERIEKSEKDKLRKLKDKAEATYLEKEEIVNNAIYHNAFEWRFEFPEVLADDGSYIGFDAVIGNPPYMRIQEISKTQSKEKLFYEKKYSVAKSSYDLANLFFERAIDISKSDANNSYIFPHKFFNSSSTESFRDFLTKGQYIDKIVHFGANMIFDEADTYTCIANFSGINNDGFYIYKSAFKDNYQHKMLQNENFNFITYDDLKSFSKLYGSNQWIFPEGSHGVSIFKKIYNSGIVLKDKFEGIYQGIATSKDDLYIGELVKETESTYVLSFKALNVNYEVEKCYFKPILRGKDIHRYKNLKTSLYVFFPYNVVEANSKVLELSSMKEKYPLTYNYVIENENLFKSRERGKAKKMEYWYSYIYPKNLDKFEKYKLSSMEICSKHPNVTLNERFYHNTKVYSWIKRPGVSESYEYLLSIANSKVLWWFLMTTGDTLQGDARTFKTNYLNPFPLPKTISTEQEQVFVEKVKSILYLKEINPNCKTSELEWELDQMVYELYGLTEDEIAIVENS